MPHLRITERLAFAFSLPYPGGGAIVRRGIDRGELPASTSVTLLLETLIGGAMMHAVGIPADTGAAPVLGTRGAEPYRPASR